MTNDKQTLRREKENLNQRKVDGEILTIQDAYRSIASSGVNFDFNCLAFSPTNITPALSFSILSGKLHRYHTKNDLEQHLGYSPIKPIKGDEVIFESKYFVLVVNEYKKIKGIKEKCILIAEICEIVRDSSLHLRNIEYDLFQKRLTEFEKILNQSKFFSIINLCEFIQKKEHVFCYPAYVTKELTLKASANKRAEYVIDKLFDYESPDYKNKFKPLVHESIKTGKPIMDELDSIRFIIIPLIRKKEHSLRITHILIIHSLSDINHKTLSNIEELIENYLEYRFSKLQISTIFDMQTDLLKISNHQTEIKLNGKSDLLEIYKNYIKKYFHNILFSTYSDSITIRFYNHISKTLDVLHRSHSEFGSYRDGDPESYPIKITDYHSSTNAFAFSKCNKDITFIYIGNFSSKIPSEFKKLGFSKVSSKRQLTASSITFPIFLGKCPIGTINIESQLVHAFDEHLTFLKSAISMIESYFNQLLLVNDNSWIKNRVFTYDGVHELRQYCDAKKFDTKTCSVLQKYLFSNIEKQEFGEISIDKIEQEIRDEIDESNKAMDKTSKDLQNLIHFNINVKGILDGQTVNLMKLIVRNLLNNISRYGDPRKDKITIIIRKPKHEITCSEIRIYARTCGFINNEIIDKFGIIPVQKEEKQVDNLRYGMFIVGMLCRTLGGTLDIGSSKKRNLTFIEIRLPVNKDHAHEFIEDMHS